MIRRSPLPLPAPLAPRLAKRFCPIGPPRQEVVEASGAKAVALPGRYCVNYLIEGAEGLALVDPGSAADLDRIEQVSRWLEKPITWVVPSHLHFDHVLGVQPACARFSASLAVSRVAARAWEGSGRDLRLPQPSAIKIFWPTWVWQGAPVFARADLPRLRRLLRRLDENPFDSPVALSLEEGASLPGFAGWTVLLTPGHSDDAICLYHAASGLLVAGDTVRNFQGGEWNPLLTDPQDYRATIRRLSRLPVRAVLPGHGPVLAGEGVLQGLRDI